MLNKTRKFKFKVIAMMLVIAFITGVVINKGLFKSEANSDINENEIDSVVDASMMSYSDENL